MLVYWKRQWSFFSVFILHCLFDLCYSFVTRMQKLWRRKKRKQMVTKLQASPNNNVDDEIINKHARKQTRNKPFGNRNYSFRRAYKFANTLNSGKRKSKMLQCLFAIERALCNKIVCLWDFFVQVVNLLYKLRDDDNAAN